jgi:GntR family transcriptional regulator of vanillate catabolism
MTTHTDRITETLRDWLLDGRIRPGERIEEVPLSLALGVSRTPVRAALSTLAGEGLIEHEPNRGYRVRIFDLADLAAAYEVRASLEGLACRLAAIRGLGEEQAGRMRACLSVGDSILARGELRPADHAPYQQMNVEFHTSLLEASGNLLVQRFVRQAQAIPFASDRIVLWNDHAVILRSHDDHHRILRAVIARDARRAEELMREHIVFAGEHLRENYRLLAATAGRRRRDGLPAAARIGRQTSTVLARGKHR